MSIETPDPLKQYIGSLRYLLDETFENAPHMYLAPPDPLFPTLSDVSADEASQRISVQCACLAAQVEHVCVYLEMTTIEFNGGDEQHVDWTIAWQCERVNDEEWAALKSRLRAAYTELLAAFEREENWQRQWAVPKSLSTLVHTAYHLGEIRQGLGVLRG